MNERETERRDGLTVTCHIHKVQVEEKVELPFRALRFNSQIFVSFLVVVIRLFAMAYSNISAFAYTSST